MRAGSRNCAPPSAGKVLPGDKEASDGLPQRLVHRLCQSSSDGAPAGGGAGAPVVYVQHANQGKLLRGSAGWQLHAALLPPADDLHVHKTHGSAFEETDLDRKLAACHAGTVVVTGLVTHGCIRAACLDAGRLGYEVILPQDGHSNFNRKGAALIDEWNTKLAAAGVTVIPAQEVVFAAGTRNPPKQRQESA